MKLQISHPLCLASLLLLWSLTEQPALASPPVVVSVKPEPGATDVPLYSDGLVEIRFDQAMNKGSVINAVSMSPIDASFAWKFHREFRWKDDRTLSFIWPGSRNVGDSLTSGTSFTVTIRPSARNLNGEPLSQPFRWSFSTKDRIVANDQVRPLLSSAYRQHFDLEIPFPAYFESVPKARPDNLGENMHYWTSAAYVGSHVYRIYLLDDGTILKNEQLSKRPQGTYRVGLVAIDHGNTNIAQLMSTLLVTEQNEINRNYEAFAASRGYGRPILRFINTNILVSASEIVSPRDRDQIVALLEDRGYSKDSFDLFVSLDMDASNRSGGFANGDFIYISNYLAAADLTGLWSGNRSALYRILSAAYDHEGGHLFGWEHEWTSSAVSGTFITSPILYGWTDADGDRVPEIWDPTPYGLTEAPSLPSFILVPSVGSQSVSPGASAAFKIKVRPFGGFTQPVDISASVYPPDEGVNVALSSNHVVPGARATLTVNTNPSTRPSTFTVVFVGKSGEIVSIDSVRVKVKGKAVRGH